MSVEYAISLLMARFFKETVLTKAINIPGNSSLWRAFHGFIHIFTFFIDFVSILLLLPFQATHSASSRTLSFKNPSWTLHLLQCLYILASFNWTPGTGDCSSLLALCPTFVIVIVGPKRSRNSWNSLWHIVLATNACSKISSNCAKGIQLKETRLKILHKGSLYGLDPDVSGN